MDHDQAKSSPEPDHDQAKSSPKPAKEGIVSPDCNDVLLGRGTLINAGNQQYLHLVQQAKRHYVMSPKKNKGDFALNIMKKIKRLNPPGRFLKQDPKSMLWYEISHMSALHRTRQSLRDGAPKLKKQIERIEEEEKEKSSDNTNTENIDGMMISEAQQNLPDLYPPRFDVPHYSSLAAVDPTMMISNNRLDNEGLPHGVVPAGGMMRLMDHQNQDQVLYREVRNARVEYNNLRQEMAHRRLRLSILEQQSQVMEARARISYMQGMQQTIRASAAIPRAIDTYIYGSNQQFDQSAIPHNSSSRNMASPTDDRPDECQS
eukprot:scaffold25907_cov60-Attheya_sp.AAC.1